ncbi:MAG: PEP/pyruvate-binding domain-containing protein, partial [Vicinamibacteria bacterium]
MSPLLDLADATDATVVGHKAATLAVLRRAGFDIPDGFVIPAGVTPSLEAIAGALERLGPGPVAVRSSGTAEDLADASFAGQYDTRLNVSGADAVLAAVRACVASASDGRAEAYGHTAGPMAVLVQRMVAADAAGVAFSANPMTGDRHEVRVSATRGLGDALVSGAVDADEWRVRGDDTMAVAEPQQAVGPDMVRRIAALARRAEAARRAPQDIEWAVSGDRLWLLQSRPITALPVPPEIEVPAGTWQKDAGHFAEPLAPFSVSTQIRDADTFLNEAIERWGLLPDRIQFRVIGHEPYIHVEPDDGGKNPPPWWVLGALVRVVPQLRRKLKAAARAVDAGWLETVPAAWDAEDKPRLRREIARFAAIDLRALDDATLFAHIDELSRFYAR